MELNEIVRKIVDDKISDIHTCLPAKIESYDPKTMRADVVLLSKKELDNEMKEIPPILECPVALLKAGPFVIRQPFEKGDPVLVVFSEKSLEKLLITGDPENPQIKHRHSLDDAIVIGGLQLEQDPDLNSEYTSDLLIENQDEDTRWVMQKDGVTLFENKKAEYKIEFKNNGDISVYGSGNVNIDADSLVNLQGGTDAIARKGDEIEVEITTGSSAGTYTGEIITGSERSYSG